MCAGSTPERADEFFLPPLIGKLIAAGKVLQPGQCYTYVTLPIFKEGSYTVENLVPMSMKEHFELTGKMHGQLQDLPDGATVKINITD